MPRILKAGMPPPSIRDERGITVVEMLTGLMLFAMVSAVLYSFMLLGVSMYQRISAETQLRNQADALYGRILSELDGAVYASQGTLPDGSRNDKEVLLVKRDSDPEVYVDAYRIVIEPAEANGPYGLSVYGPGSVVPKRFEMTNAFEIDLAKSSLNATWHHELDMHLSFRRANVSELTAAEQTDIAIHATVPLLRLE